MDNAILFKETQKFKQWWIWLLLIAGNAVLLHVFFQQVIFKKSLGHNAPGPIFFLFLIIVSFFISLLFLKLKLLTIIKDDGIYVQFFPFHWSLKKYTWDTLEKCYIRKYSPLAEYGGWGLRIGLFGKGTAFNVSGNMGMQLQFKNNKKLLIGTVQSEALQKILQKIGQYKE